MRPGGSSIKGGVFEREISKRLSLWLSNGTRKDLFWRSAMSGGRFTMAYHRGDNIRAQVGDISMVDTLGSLLTDKFCIECKHYKDLNLRGLFFKHKVGLPEFWVTTIRDAQRSQKLPLLIAKQNRYPTLLCLNSKGIYEFGLTVNGCAKSGFLRLWVPKNDLYIFWFDDFLKMISPLELQPKDVFIN